MAKAVVIKRQDVCLHLNDREAGLILDVLAQVTGSQDSRRRIADHLINMLEGAGYVWKKPDDISGTIRFSEKAEQ